jgi:branched-subunit amino acid transport protein AzlD
MDAGRHIGHPYRGHGSGQRPRSPGTAVPVFIAVAATVAVHHIVGRRTLLSVETGSAIYVALVNVS